MFEYPDGHGLRVYIGTQVTRCGSFDCNGVYGDLSQTVGT